MISLTSKAKPKWTSWTQYRWPPKQPRVSVKTALIFKLVLIVCELFMKSPFILACSVNYSNSFTVSMHFIMFGFHIFLGFFSFADFFLYCSEYSSVLLNINENYFQLVLSFSDFQSTYFKSYILNSWISNLDKEEKAWLFLFGVVVCMEKERKSW